MAYLSYIQLNNLEQASFIGGSAFYLDFELIDGNSKTPIDLSGATITVKISPYGKRSSTVTLTKTASLVDDNRKARVLLLSDETEGLYGRYIYQLSYSGDFFIETGTPQALSSFNTSTHTDYVLVPATQPDQVRRILAFTDNTNPDLLVQVGVLGTNENDIEIYDEFDFSGGGGIGESNSGFKTITSMTFQNANIGNCYIQGGAYLDNVDYIIGRGTLLILEKIP